MGFMPAFKYRQKNSLIVFERGHKAHGYVQTADGFLLGNRPSRPGLQHRQITDLGIGRLRTVLTRVPSHNELDSLVILGFLQGKARRCLPLLFQFPFQLLRLLPDFRGVVLFFDCAPASPCEHTRIREKEI